MFERMKLGRKKMAPVADQEEKIPVPNVPTREQQERSGRSVSDLLTKLSDAEERARVAEETCAQVVACHAGQERIGHMPINPEEMTARARTVEGSIRCVWSVDNRNIVFYADRVLTEAEFNAMVSVALPAFNRT